MLKIIMDNGKITLEYDKPKCKIYHHQEVNAIEFEWFGHVSHEEFVDACDFFLELLIKHKSSKMIANNLNSEAVTQQNQDWLDKVWFPRIYEHGFRTAAVIRSKSIFNQVTVKKIADKMDKSKYILRFFTTVQEATEWLKTI